MGNGCIVVADDDQGILESFEAILGDKYEIKLVRNGSEAITAVDELKPNLLFLDVKMPGLSGMDVLRALKSRKATVPVVMVTALPQAHYEDVAHDFGVLDYLRKPFDVDDIERIASTAFGLASGQ